MSAAELSEDLLQRGFQLSYFVLLDRPRARECLARALEKLAAQRTREKRRAYWRSRKQDLTIRRISRPMQDTLQWLVCLESEASEREQEMQGLPTEADMIVRYVKHLAQMTTVSSSFHVNVGFNRLLRSYSTPEVQQLYELATVRYPASEEYRKAKGKLLNQLAARFEQFLRIRTGANRELQFETHTEHSRWAGLVEECLEVFSPWSAQQSCLRDASELQEDRSRVRSSSGSVPRAPDRLETNRCHWFMHAICCGRLVEQLGFDPPEERLAVPRFLHHDGGDSSEHKDPPERRAAPLSPEENELLNRRVAAAAKREALPLVPMKLIAHGVVCASIDPARAQQCRFEIPEGTRLLEIRGELGGEDRILATHWIDYGEGDRFLQGEYTVVLQRGRRLVLSVLPASGTDGQPGSRAFMTVRSGSAWRLRESWGSLASFLGEATGPFRAIVAGVALAGLAVLLGGVYFSSRLSDDQLYIARLRAEVSAQKAALAEQERVPKALPQELPRYAFNAEVPNVRAPGGSGEPVVTFGPGTPTMVLELPVGRDPLTTYRVTLSSFPEAQERLSEAGLKAIRRGDRWILEFTLPANLVEADTHYLLSIKQTGHEEARRYLFEVRKQ